MWSKLLRVLNHPVLSAAGNAYTVLTAIPGVGSVISAAAAPFTTTQWLILSAFLFVVTIIVSRTRFGRIDLGFQDELAAILEQARQLDQRPFFELHYGSYTYWHRKTAGFLAATLGPSARANYETLDGFDAERAWLLDLLRHPERWKLRGNVEKAAKERREATAEELVVLAGGPIYPGSDDA